MGRTRQRFAGQVLGNGTILHDATFMVGGERSDESNVPCSFHVRAENGSTIRVDVSDSATLGPRLVLHGRWSEIANAPLSRPFASAAPGNHVKVKLSGVVITAGDEVAVEGELVSSDPPVVNAGFIGIGKGAAQWVAERADQADREQCERQQEHQELDRLRVQGGELSVWPAIPIVLTGLSAVVYGETLLPTTDPSQIFAVRASQVSGLFLVTLALFLWRRRRFTLRMLEANPPSPGGDVLWGLHPWATALIGIGLPGSLVLAATSLEKGGGLGVASYLGALFVTSTLWGVLILETRKDTRALKTIATTRPEAGDGWGRRLGSVLDGELKRQRTHRKTSTTTKGSAQVRDAITGSLQSVETSSTSTWYKAFQSGGAGTLKVQVGDRTLEVAVRGNARWGTTRRSVKGLTLTEWLLPGDQVLLVGRVEDGKMSAKGEESLFVLGAHRGDVGNVLVRELWAHWMGMIGFVLVIAAEIYFTFAN